MSRKKHDTQCITPEQVKAARELLRISAAELADKAAVSSVSVRRWESYNAVPVGQETVAKIIQALRDEGVEFINRGDVVGVKLRK